MPPRPRPFLIPEPRGWDWDPSNFRSAASISPLSSVDWDPFPPAPTHPARADASATTEDDSSDESVESVHGSCADDAVGAESGEGVAEASVTETQRTVSEWRAAIQPSADRESSPFVEQVEGTDDDKVDEMAENKTPEQPQHAAGAATALDEQSAAPPSTDVADAEATAAVTDQVPEYGINGK